MMDAVAVPTVCARRRLRRLHYSSHEKDATTTYHEFKISSYFLES